MECLKCLRYSECGNVIVSKSNQVDCIFYRGDNVAEVLTFCGNKATANIIPGSWPIIIIQCNKIKYNVFPNNYIVKENNSFSVYSVDDFEKNFDVVREC